MKTKTADTAPKLDAAGRSPGHELYGEPEITRKVIRLPPQAKPWRRPLSEIARAAVMDGRDPWEATARKFTPTVEARPGEVPQEGTPQRQAEARTDGSTLPVVAASRSIPDTGDLWANLLETGKILSPPYDPWLLVCAVDESDTLPQCVDVMARNIGGHGVQLDPLFEVKDPTTGAEIAVPAEAKTEREDLELWLAGLCIPHGLQGLLDLADRDTETVGWGTIEVLRDSAGQIADMGHIPAYTVRLGPEHSPTLVERTIRHPSTGELVTVRRWARFRLFCQVKEGRTVWFKALGDPRHVNWKTGQVRPETAGPWPVDQLGNSMEATELIYVRNYHPATPYGVPRWLGGIPHVRASRAAAELLVDWFDNAPIGVKIAMIAGGRWKDGGLSNLQDALDHGARGMKNAWNVLALEGDTGTSDRDVLDETRDSPARATLEDLSTEIPAGLYQGRESLIDRSSVRVRAMFRLGAIYFGDSEGESNRAAADTARSIGEEQVFKPIRLARWGNLLNRQILPGMGINYWALSLSGAKTSDDSDGLAAALAALVEGGGASPNALARLYADMTGNTPDLVAEAWGDRPLSLTMALIVKGLDPNKDLSELAAEAAKQAEDMASSFGGDDDPNKPPSSGDDEDEDKGAKVARKAMAVQDLLDLRGALAAQLRAEGGDELARSIDDLPTSWTDRA